MNPRNRSLLSLAGTFALLLTVFPAGASARDRRFSAVVDAVSTTYNAHQNYRFVSWFAGMATKFARPEGVKSLRMAIFDEQDFTPRDDDASLEETVQKALEPEWQPFVRVRSNRNSERTLIYAREKGKDISLFIVTLEQTEAVVMEVKVSEKKLAQMANDPENAAGSLRVEERDERAASASREGTPPTATLQRRDMASPENP